MPRATYFPRGGSLGNAKFARAVLYFVPSSMATLQLRNETAEFVLDLLVFSLNIFYFHINTEKGLGYKFLQH